MLKFIKGLFKKEEVKIVANLSDECDFDRFYVNQARTLADIANETVADEDRKLRNLLKLKKWSKQGMEEVTGTKMLENLLELKDLYAGREWLEVIIKNSVTTTEEVIEKEIVKTITAIELDSEDLKTATVDTIKSIQHRIKNNLGYVKLLRAQKFEKETLEAQERTLANKISEASFQIEEAITNNKSAMGLYLAKAKLRTKSFHYSRLNLAIRLARV